MSDDIELSQRTLELRRAFDRAFARPAVQASEEATDLLKVRIAGHPYAIAVREVQGLFGRLRIAPVPARAVGLLGLAGVRGEIVSVFSLSVLLGHGHDAEPPSWLVVCGGSDAVALAFGEIEGHTRLPRSGIHADRASHPASTYVSEVATIDGGVRPIVATSSIVADIRRRRATAASEQER